MDSHPKQLREDEKYYSLNIQNEVNPNGANNGAANTLGTPLPANYPACEIEQPAGENYSPNTYESKRTNEVYDLVYNSNEVNYLKRINSKGTCEIVYQGDCLKLSADPKHQITQFRANMRIEKVCANRDGKYFIWTDGKYAIGYIDTEASIATNSFTTPFFQRCADPCAYIQLCVPEICGCLSGEFIDLPLSEASITNHLVDVPIQVMIRHVYYDGRASEWSDRSIPYYQSKGCFDTTAGFSRCLKFRIPVGNPLVDKIEFAFSKDGGKTWLLSDTIEKYKKYNSSQEKWYERDFSEIVSSTFSDVDCSFDYIFCNDKQCQTIDPKEYTRVRNPIPVTPQCIIEIEDALGFVNYVDGVCPLDEIESQKLKIGINCDSGICQQEFAKVTVRALLHNFVTNENQFIYRFGGDYQSKDDPTDTAWFGGVETIAGLPFFGVKNGYGQLFRDTTRNFIVYIDGEGSYADMKQKVNTSVLNSGVAGEIGVLAGMSSIQNVALYYNVAKTIGIYQEAVIYVPKGTKGFLRLTSHHEVAGNEDTSTNTVGTLNITNYRSGVSLNQVLGWTPYKKEIYFDTCNGDVDLTEAFVIQDDANVPDQSNRSSIAYSGYIRLKDGTPIEGAEVWVQKDGNAHTKISQTDHNGFYNFSVRGEELTNGQIRVERDCAAFSSIMPFILDGNFGGLTERDYEIENAQYATDFYEEVKVRVVDCDGRGAGGLIVSLSESKHRTTDANGFATFKARNFSSRHRQYVAIVANNNGCISKDCFDNCAPCIVTGTGTAISCFAGVPSINLTQIQINAASINQNNKGLKSGGSYDFGILGQGSCGILSAVYENVTLDIPKTQVKNKFGFCKFTYDVTGMKLPPDWQCLKIVRSINKNPYELQWLVDKKERTPDGKLKLTIQSLNDYNAKYFFKTNTIYQWLKNDRVEFIRNGDGKIFDTATYGALNFQTISPFNDEVVSSVSTKDDANFFNQLIINDNGALQDLQEGALIEIQRSKECTTEPIYYEFCVSIPLIPVFNGGVVTHTEPEYPTGEFTSFDTFVVNRKIGKFPSQIFEHFSPSDFWGEKLDGRGIDDLGKAHFVNKYENRRRYGSNITINSPTQFNYFGDLIKKLKTESQGDITAAKSYDNKFIKFIFEKDNANATISDDFLRLGSEGVVIAAPADSIISEPQQKLVGQFGCQYSHIGSVLFGDGWATWVDVDNHSYIIDNFQFAKVASVRQQEDGTVYSQCNTYFRKRCQEIQTFNQAATDILDYLRFSTGINRNTNIVYLTIKSLRHPAINNEQAPYLKPNETIMYHPESDNFKGFASFTMEGYSNLNLFDGQGCAMISFYNGVPYIHPILSDKFNEFCGIACDMHVGIALNKFPDKQKIAVAYEIQDDKMWFVSDVKTADPNFRSEVPPIRVKRSENHWNAPFLNDINSRGGLYNGKQARGYYVKVLFTRDNSIDNIYGSVNDLKRVQYSELDNIICKFMTSEQSGMTEDK